MALVCFLVKLFNAKITTAVLCTETTSLRDILPGHAILVETNSGTCKAKVLDIAWDKTQLLYRGRRIEQSHRTLRVYRRNHLSTEVMASDPRRCLYPLLSRRPLAIFMDEEVRFEEDGNDFHQHNIPTRSRPLQGESRLLPTGHSNVPNIPHRRPMLEQISNSSLNENQAGNMGRNEYNVVIHHCREHRECRERLTGYSSLQNSPQAAQGNQLDGNRRSRSNQIKIQNLQHSLHTEFRPYPNARNSVLDALDGYQNSLPSTSTSSSRQRLNKRNRSCPARRERRVQPQHHHSLQNLHYPGQQVFIDEGSSDEDDIEVSNINQEINANRRGQRNIMYERFWTPEFREKLNSIRRQRNLLERPTVFVDEGSSDDDLQNEDNRNIAPILSNRQYSVHNLRREQIRGRRSLPDVYLRSAMFVDDSSSTPSSDIDVPAKNRGHERSIPIRSFKVQRGHREQPNARNSLPSAPERHQNRQNTGGSLSNIIKQSSLVHGQCRKQPHRRSNPQNISQRHQAYDDTSSDKDDNENTSNRHDVVHNTRRKQSCDCGNLQNVRPGPTVFIDESLSDTDEQSQPHNPSNIPNQKSQQHQGRSNTHNQPSTSRGTLNRSHLAYGDLKGQSHYHSRTPNFLQGQQVRADEAFSDKDTTEGSGSDQSNISGRTYTIHSEGQEQTDDDNIRKFRRISTNSIDLNVQNPPDDSHRDGPNIYNLPCSVHSKCQKQSNDHSNPTKLCRSLPVFGDGDISDIEHENPFAHDLDLPNLLGPTFSVTGERGDLHDNQQSTSSQINDSQIQPDNIVNNFCVMELQDQNLFDNSRSQHNLRSRPYRTGNDRQEHSIIPQGKPMSEIEDSNDGKDVNPKKQTR